METGEENVVELNAHAPSVSSVIRRLGTYQEKIKSVTAIVEWNDGSYDVLYDTKTTPDLAYDKLVLEKFLLELIETRGWEK